LGIHLRLVSLQLVILATGRVQSIGDGAFVPYNVLDSLSGLCEELDASENGLAYATGIVIERFTSACEKILGIRP
jgi:hypothetical protein